MKRPPIPVDLKKKKKKKKKASPFKTDPDSCAILYEDVPKHSGQRGPVVD